MTDDLEASDAAWAVSVTLFYGPAVLTALGWLWWRGGLPRIGALLGHSPSLGLGLGLLSAAAVIASTRLLSPRWAWARRMEQSLARSIGSLSVLTCVWLALWSAAGEELVFRAALQPAVGAIPATLLFAAIHIPFERDLWPWPLFALLVGALFAALYATTGGVLAPFIAHFTINAVNLSTLAARARPPASALS